MRTIRRLYFYAVALISLEVVVWGLIGLLRSIFSSTLINTTAVLAQALALVLVGVPIFLFHWLWAQSNAAKDNEERAATLRAVFFYAALIATLVPVVQNALALINRLALGVTNISVSRALVGGIQTWQDNLIAISINVLVALYFWNILRAEWKTLPDIENFADVRRLFRYLWLLYGLLMVIYGTQLVIRYIFYIPEPTYLLGVAGQEMLINGLALLLIGTPIWVFTWRICQDALAAPVEQASNLRLGVLYLLSLGGVITVLSAGGTLLDVVLRWSLGETMRVYEFIQQIGRPISLGVPLAGVWAYYGSWLSAQIQLDGNMARRAGKSRLYYYILSALGLGASFVGVALVLSFVIDLLTSSALWGDALRPRLATAISTLIVGLPLWLRTWRSIQKQALQEGDIGDQARRSIIRRTYLYLALFAGVIGGMVAAVALVFQLVNALLANEPPADFLPSLLNATQLLMLFSVLLVYHLSCMRRDSGLSLRTFDERQSKFPVMLLDSGDETITRTVQAAMAKHAPDVPIQLRVIPEGEEADMFKAVIIPASLVVAPPDELRTWLKRFRGEKIVVREAVPGWVFNALTPEQAAQVTRRAVDGEEIRLPGSSTTWNVIQTIAVVILGIQILFFLFALGISLVGL